MFATSGSFSIPGIVVILVILGVAGLAQGVILTMRGRFWRSAGAQHRGPWLVVRVLCAALGVGLLVAVGLGTRHAAHAIYTGNDTITSIQVHVPTQPVDAALAEAADLNEAEAQYLVHLVIVEFDAAGARPLAVEEFRISWPGDNGRSFTGTLKDAGVTIRTEFTVNDIARITPSAPDAAMQPGPEAGSGGQELVAVEFTGPGMPGGLSLSGSHSLWVESWATSFSSTDNGIGISGREVQAWLPLRKPVLSTAQKRLASIQAFYLVTQANAGDPLRMASADELLARHPAVVDQLGQRLSAESQQPGNMAASVSGGARLAYSLGFTTMLLAVAVFALVIAVPGRAFAAIGVSLFVVLYVVALDRAVLDYHLRKADDAKAPVEQRLLACAQTTDTFFFRRTARAHVEAVAKDANAPPKLLPLAARVRSLLSE